MRAFFLLALLTAAVVASSEDKYWGSAEERNAIIEEAIKEAKDHAKLQDVKLAAAKSKQTLTATQFLARGFKKPSNKALINGKARLLMEDMVYRAERKLLELKKKKNSPLSNEENAEILADELIHQPGTLLKEDELARMNLLIGCVDEREFAKRCRRLLNIDTFRTTTGVCNNLRVPLRGVSGRDFRRLLPARYEDRVGSLVGGRQGRSELGLRPFQPPNPSARTVSSTIVRPRAVSEIPFTHILMQWGQFLDHDMSLGPEIEAECEGCTFTPICEPIRVQRNDEVFGVGTKQNGDCLPFRRAIPTCQTNGPSIFSPREQINDLTSFIDASMVYGSNRKQENAVRAFRNGLLRSSAPVRGTNQRLLPVIRKQDEFIQCRERNDCFLCGDIRCNEQVSLTVMHTIWLREHNRIARDLRRINRFWSDERLYQETRKIVGALIQKITYIDYLPKVMGPDVFNQLIGRFRRYNPRIDPAIPNAFATAAYRYGHSLIRPRFDRLGPRYEATMRPLNLADMFFRPDQIANSRGTDSIVRGWVSVLARRVDEFVNRILTSRLFETDISPGMDLASLNIQRQRDHGMPGYTAWRRFCQRTFPSLPAARFANSLTSSRFATLHGTEDEIDLWIGGLAERRIPGSLLGPTFACIFALTFRDVRDGDRFYYESPGVFTSAQLRQINSRSLSRVLCDTSDTIRQIQPDAFVNNETRQSCQSLTPLSLEPWREDLCFIRASIPRNIINRIPILTLARRIGRERRPVETFSNTNPELSRECLPVPCPSSTISVSVYSYPRIRNFNSCRFTTRLPFRRISGSTSSFFNAGLRPNLINTNGFFDSFDRCRSSSVSAITWTCDSNVEAAVAGSTIALNDGDAPASDNLESPDSLTETPPGYNESFNVAQEADADETDTSTATNESKKVDELENKLVSSKEEESNTKTEEVLSQELLEALKNLH